MENLFVLSLLFLFIPIRGIFRRNSILAYFDDPRYRRKSSGITKWGTLGAHSIVKNRTWLSIEDSKKWKKWIYVQRPTKKKSFVLNCRMPEAHRLQAFCMQILVPIQTSPDCVAGSLSMLVKPPTYTKPSKTTSSLRFSFENICSFIGWVIDIDFSFAIDCDWKISI